MTDARRSEPVVWYDESTDPSQLRDVFNLLLRKGWTVTEGATAPGLRISGWTRNDLD